MKSKVFAMLVALAGVATLVLKVVAYASDADGGGGW